MTRTQILAFRRQVGALDRRLPAGDARCGTRRGPACRTACPARHSCRSTPALKVPSPIPGKIRPWCRSGARATTSTLSRYTTSRSLRSARLPDARQVAGARRAGRPPARVPRRRRMRYDDAGQALGVHGNTSATPPRPDARDPLGGRPPPDSLDGAAARHRRGQATLELARRYLHVFGPATRRRSPSGLDRRAAAVARSPRSAGAAAGPHAAGRRLDARRGRAAIRDSCARRLPARLLPERRRLPGRQSADRELLVPDAARRRALDPSRLAGRAPGRRRGRRHVATRPGTDDIRTLATALAPAREAVVAEAESLPLPGTAGRTVVHWD